MDETTMTLMSIGFMIAAIFLGFAIWVCGIMAGIGDEPGTGIGVVGGFVLGLIMTFLATQGLWHVFYGATTAVIQ